MDLCKQDKIFVINQFFLKINEKKQITKTIKKHIYLLKIFHYKILCIKLLNFKIKFYLIKYIIKILVHKSNLFFYVNNCFGDIFLYYSIGLLKLNKKKFSKSEILQEFLKIISLKIKFLKHKPISIDLFNINFNYSWLLEKLFIKLIILAIRIYNNISYNGCRKKKIKKK